MESNPLLSGVETPVDVIRRKDGSLLVITDKDLTRIRLGLIPDPYDQ